jgi:hypothetical protein
MGGLKKTNEISMIEFGAFAIVCEVIAYKNDINYAIKKIPILDLNTKHFKHFVFSINFFLQILCFEIRKKRIVNSLKL